MCSSRDIDLLTKILHIVRVQKIFYGARGTDLKQTFQKPFETMSNCSIGKSRALSSNLTSFSTLFDPEVSLLEQWALVQRCNN